MSAPSKENFFQSLTADTWCGWVPEVVRLFSHRPGVSGTRICPIGRVKPPKGKTYLCILFKDADSPRERAGTGSREMAGQAD